MPFLIAALALSARAFAAAPGAQSQTAPAAAAKNSVALIQQASWAMAALEYGKAYDLASQAITANPGDTEAWSLRAVIDNKLGRYDQALQDAQAALRLAPSNAPALLNRSWTYSRLKRYDQALQDAQSVLKENPNDGFAYQDAAMAMAGLGNRDGALSALRRCAELNPEFEGRYAMARQAVSGGEILAILDQDAQAEAAPNPKAAARGPALMLLTLSGGLLFALGILSFFPLTWRPARSAKPSSRKPAAKPSVKTKDAPEPYEIIKPLGQNPLELSYQARDKALGRLVTLRKLRREIRTDPQARRRFLREARVIASLHHPNILDVYQIAEDGEDIYLILEWFDGVSLAQILERRGPMSYLQACQILKPLCAAVDYAYAKGLIHGGLRPEIIAVSKDDAVKITDFGLTQAMEDTLFAAGPSPSPPQTPNEYAAPEQDKGEPCPQSDVFALGACFYEMLCGRKPFKGEGHFLALNKAGGFFVPIPSEATQGVPLSLDETFKKAFAPDPASRYQTAKELYGAFARLVPRE